MEGPKKRGARRDAALLLAGGGGATPFGPAGGAEAEQEPGAERRVLSRKELARELRREAYQRAKRARAADPRHQALKELAKQRRRELYQKVKEQRKAREAQLESRNEVARQAERAEAKRQLAERVRGALGKAAGSAKAVESGQAVGGGEAAGPGPALARDIERALEDAELRALMDQLRVQSAALAARDQLGPGAPGGGAARLRGEPDAGEAPPCGDADRPR